MPFEAASKENSGRVTKRPARPMSSLDKVKKGLPVVVSPSETKITHWHQKLFSVF